MYLLPNHKCMLVSCVLCAAIMWQTLVMWEDNSINLLCCVICKGIILFRHFCSAMFIHSHGTTKKTFKSRWKKLGIEDIQVEGAKLDSDMRHNNNSCKQNTINTKRQNKRGGTKQTLLHMFSFQIIFMEAIKTKTRHPEVIINRR